MYARRVREPGDTRVVVIGSGPPGAAAAHFLCRAGAEVLLLEAGSAHAARGLTVRVAGFTVLRYGRTLRVRQGAMATADPDTKLYEELAPGGLTNHWSGAVPRFSEDDFADAARAGDAYKWPIGYSDLAPWYNQVEPLLHIAGPGEGSSELPSGRVSHARKLGADWARIGLEASREGRALSTIPYAYGAETTATFSGTVFNSFVRIVKPELRAGRLKTHFDARVLRLEWSPRSRRVEAVVFRDTRTGTENRVPCRAVVLAAGAIGTSEILLASSSADFPQGLGNEHGVLGHYLHDHPIAKIIVDLGRPISLHPPAYLTRPALDRAPPLYAAACAQWGGTMAVATSIWSGKPGRTSSLGFNFFGTMAPSPDNWVALGPTNGHNGTNGVGSLDLHIRYPPEALTCLQKARDDLLDILGRAGLEPRVRAWKVEPVGASNHYGGTCRMHESPTFGMLNGWSRLHAVPNVAVVDSSGFTTGPEKNPVLSAMALAARASHHLAEELKAGDI